mgnify:CR=1 FL=1
MPVEKFRSLDEMQRAQYRRPAVSQAELLARIDQLWRRAARLAPPPCKRPRGVFRFRSLEEAQLARQRMRDGS